MGDGYFWGEQEAGETVWVTATPAQLSDSARDPGVCSNRVAGSIREGLLLPVAWNPLEQLRAMEPVGPLEQLPGENFRLRGTFTLLQVVSRLIEPLGQPGEGHLDRYLGAPEDYFTATVQGTLEVDRDGVPRRTEWQPDAVIEGSRPQPVSVVWRVVDTPPPSLPEVIPYARLLLDEPWPTDWIPSHEIDPPNPDGASITRYLAQQRAALESALDELGDALMRALITLREPTSTDILPSLNLLPETRVEYFEYETAGGRRGRVAACDRRSAEEIRQALYPD
ncbi:MAG: hypothetical protein M5U22_13505 [Thermoleophilia bacterium]|nr:hypothetical protein [Thermoleophilia bacterium]